MSRAEKEEGRLEKRSRERAGSRAVRGRIAGQGLHKGKECGMGMEREVRPQLVR